MTGISPEKLTLTLQELYDRGDGEVSKSGGPMQDGLQTFLRTTPKLSYIITECNNET